MFQVGTKINWISRNMFVLFSYSAATNDDISCIKQPLSTRQADILFFLKYVFNLQIINPPLCRIYLKLKGENKRYNVMGTHSTLCDFLYIFLFFRILKIGFSKTILMVYSGYTMKILIKNKSRYTDWQEKNSNFLAYCIPN